MKRGANLHLIALNPLLVVLTLLVFIQQSGAQPVKLVKDIFPGPNVVKSLPDELTDVGGLLYFNAESDVQIGRELWKSDGTLNGTVLIKDINPGSLSSTPSDLTSFNGILYFVADDGSVGRELWKSDGTNSGTVLIKDINPGSKSAFRGFSWFTVVNNTLFFIADDGATGPELWKSDGTTSGTVLVKDINPGPAGSNLSSLVNVNGTLFFTADDGVTGDELWKSDGTASGTILVKDINPGPSGSRALALANVNGILIFSGNDGVTGNELWKSDGTPNGTVLIKDINPGPSSSILGAFFIPLNGNFYFNANDGINGNELWTSDGTSNGTLLVKDINPGPNGSGIGDMINFNGKLFFNANDGVHGDELWMSDGTTAGTVLVKDIFTGPENSIPRRFTISNKLLFFVASDINTGFELWRTDGTSTGTVLVEDIYPGTFSSNPIELTDVSNALFFSAFNPGFGVELWATLPPIIVTLTPSNPPIQIPPQGGQFKFTITLTNDSGRLESKQVWNEVILPDGSTLGPTIGPVTVEIPSGEFIDRVLTQNVPGEAQSGQYTYIFNVGTFPDEVEDSDSFIFTKLSPTTAIQELPSTGADGWTVVDLELDAWQNFMVEDEIVNQPDRFILHQNYPNPFNPTTTILYQLPQAAQVSIILYDLSGRQVRELVHEYQEAGEYRVSWDGTDQSGRVVASGVYVYEIRAGSFRDSHKMIFIK